MDVVPAQSASRKPPPVQGAAEHDKADGALSHRRVGLALEELPDFWGPPPDDLAETRVYGLPGIASESGSLPVSKEGNTGAQISDVSGAHLRSHCAAVSSRLPQLRGAGTARALLAGLVDHLKSSIRPLSGDVEAVALELGVTASRRTLLATFALLAEHTGLIRPTGRGKFEIPIDRILSRGRRMVRTCTVAEFEAAIGKFAMPETPAASAAGPTSPSEFLRGLRDRAREAAELVLEYGDDGAESLTAWVRAHLALFPRRQDWRHVGNVAAALKRLVDAGKVRPWIGSDGLVRFEAVGVKLDGYARGLGIDVTSRRLAPLEAAPPSPRMQDFLRRSGHARPEALGRGEAVAMQRRLFIRPIGALHRANAQLRIRGDRRAAHRIASMPTATIAAAIPAPPVLRRGVNIRPRGASCGRTMREERVDGVPPVNSRGVEGPDGQKIATVLSSRDRHPSGSWRWPRIAFALRGVGGECLDGRSRRQEGAALSDSRRGERMALSEPSVSRGRAALVDYDRLGGVAGQQDDPATERARTGVDRHTRAVSFGADHGVGGGSVRGSETALNDRSRGAGALKADRPSERPAGLTALEAPQSRLAPPVGRALMDSANTGRASSPACPAKSSAANSPLSKASPPPSRKPAASAACPGPSSPRARAGPANTCSGRSRAASSPPPSSSTCSAVSASPCPSPRPLP